MKLLIYLLIVISSLSLNTYAQAKNDTNKTIIYESDIYNNFKQEPGKNRGYFVLKNKETGKVLYEDWINNKQCPECYDKMTNRADSFYNKKGMLDAAYLYFAAFKLNNDKGKVKHRYNAACAWVQLNNYENAFGELWRIAFIAKYHNVD